MIENVLLVKPTMELREEYWEFYQEWLDSKELIVPWVVSKDPSNFAAMIQALEEDERKENLKEGWVSASTYWLVSESNKVIGAANIRHKLTERLYYSGGHIGYGIRPSERRRGYATRLLALALVITKELGIDSVLVICDEGNLASERTILKNGGIQDTSFTEENGNVLKRFWIKN